MHYVDLEFNDFLSRAGDVHEACSLYVQAIKHFEIKYGRDACFLFCNTLHSDVVREIEEYILIFGAVAEQRSAEVGYTYSSAAWQDFNAQDRGCKLSFELTSKFSSVSTVIDVLKKCHQWHMLTLKCRSLKFDRSVYDNYDQPV